MDHNANVDTWLAAARDKGVTVRWIPVDAAAPTLELSDLASITAERTRLVAVGGASNAVGAVNDVAAFAATAKSKGALVFVDAVHAVPHLFVDPEALDIDIVTCSVYEFFGPHMGMACISEELFERLVPYKVSPAPCYIPTARRPAPRTTRAWAGSSRSSSSSRALAAVRHAESASSPGIGLSRRGRTASPLDHARPPARVAEGHAVRPRHDDEQDADSRTRLRGRFSA